MKCIIYVSKVVASGDGLVVPTGLSQLVRKSRRANIERSVTGILSYRQGHYLQVLQGESNEVDHLFSIIKEDRRHEQVTVVLDVSISRPDFLDWGMRLSESVNRDTRFVNLISGNAASIEALGKIEQRLLKIFYNPERFNSSQLKGYQDSNLMLLAWPDFTLVKQSPTVIELCAKLTKAPHSYNSLINSGHFGTQSQLDRILELFEKMEILVIDNSAVQIDSPKVNRVESVFFSKMKKFLKRAV